MPAIFMPSCSLGSKHFALRLSRLRNLYKLNFNHLSAASFFENCRRMITRDPALIEKPSPLGRNKRANEAFLPIDTPA
jgi:hypothetical protein